MMIMSLVTWLFGSLVALIPSPRVADAEQGQRLFRRCAACHAITSDGRNNLGPNLFGIVGQPAGRTTGYTYSNALKTKAVAGLVWTEDNLRAYLTNPRAFMPGGTMSFGGLQDDAQMANLLAYLRLQK